MLNLIQSEFLKLRRRKFIWLMLFASLGLFAGMQSSKRSTYPITAAFCVAWYYEATPIQFAVSLLSLLLCGGLSALLLMGLDKYPTL